jgi:hypothetical protein
MSPVAPEPREGALDHPAARQDNEAPYILAFDDLHAQPLSRISSASPSLREKGSGFRRRNSASSVAASCCRPDKAYAAMSQPRALSVRGLSLVWVFATMRSDFYNRLELLPSLARFPVPATTNGSMWLLMCDNDLYLI